MLAERGFGTGDFRVRSMSYFSHAKEIVSRRILAYIKPPPSVSANLDDDSVLHLAGEAPVDWILFAQQEARSLPGVRSVDIRGLTDPKAELIFALAKEVENARVEFRVDKDIPEPDYQVSLIKAVDDLAALEKLARGMGIAVNLIVYGHTDSTGQGKYNYELSLARAKVLAAMLYARGSSIPVSVYGMGAEYADKHSLGKSDQRSRRIELKVQLSRAATSLPELLN